jgi:hypothetical protein
MMPEASDKGKPMARKDAYGISSIATQNETPTVYVYDIEF